MAAVDAFPEERMARDLESSDAESDTESSADSVEAAFESGGAVGGRHGAVGDPSVASLPGFDAGSPSDPSVARLPEEVGGTDAAVGGDAFETGVTSVQREADSGADGGSARAGDAGVPDVVRDVVSSPGQSLDTSIQRAMEDRMGDSFGDVRVHTGPKAAAACQRLDARAFTVGNHVAFNQGEYDPKSAEGQHVIAHELAHVRQQTGGQLSMLPQEDLADAELAVDPDPQLEREAERAAQDAMSDGPVTVNPMGTEVHVQRKDWNSGPSVHEKLYEGNSQSGGDISRGDVSIPAEDLTGAVENLYYEMEQVKSELRSQQSLISSTLKSGVTTAAGPFAAGTVTGGPAVGLPAGLAGFGAGALKALWSEFTSDENEALSPNHEFIDTGDGSGTGGDNPGR